MHLLTRPATPPSGGLTPALCQVSHEREAACAQAESLTVQLSSKGSECNAFQAALLAEQRRVDELQVVSLRTGLGSAGHSKRGQLCVSVIWAVKVWTVFCFRCGQPG